MGVIDGRVARKCESDGRVFAFRPFVELGDVGLEVGDRVGVLACELVDVADRLDGLCLRFPAFSVVLHNRKVYALAALRFLQVHSTPPECKYSLAARLEYPAYPRIMPMDKEKSFMQVGGWENIMGTIRTNHPQMLDPLSGGTMPVSLYFTQWLLVGIFTFALPQSVVRCMGYKDTKSLRGAMIGGTIIIGAMMIGVTTLGVLSAGVLTGDLASYGGSVDNIIPRTIVETLPPWLAGVAIVGPVAASISTVSSLLIASSSAIIKDLWLHYADDRGQQVSDAVMTRSSQIITLGVGVIVFVLAVVPPSVIWKINMFAFGGLETAFCWVLVGALFFKRANKVGAIASMVGGTAVYCLCMALGFKLFGLHQIVIGITVSLLCMVIGSWVGNRRANAADAAADAEMREVFFPEA